MTTTPPPPRYRVVEQGRRLVVVDTRTGAQADPITPRETAPLGPERIAFDGRSILVTRRLYDDKAPRRLTLDERTTRLVEAARSGAIGAGVLLVVTMIFAPWLALVAIPIGATLASGRGRAPVRARITRWLDRYDDSAG